MIDKFDGKYKFLSNFFPRPIEYRGEWYGSVEAAFQAQKVTNATERMKFANLNPSEAKKLGRRVTLRSDWEQVKDQIMYELCLEKFSYRDMFLLLDATGDQELVEGNWWGDTYWGVSRGRGQNKLGKILMRIREELR